MKTIKKILIISILILLCINSNVLASNIFETGKEFLNSGKNVSMTGEIGTILSKLTGFNQKNKFEEVIDFLWAFGLLIIFISTVVLGIQYMFALPEEKSRIKQATTPYIVGVVIIFGALTIWKFVIMLLENVL